MRVIKFLAKLLVALVAVVLTFGILFFLMPRWQKAAVDELLSHDPARQWQVGTVRMSPFKLEATDVFMLENPVGAEIATIELNGPFWMSPISGVIGIESGRITGFMVDASQLRVGDLTSEDWQSFLARVSSDVGFWEERVELVLRKLAATGWAVSMTEVRIEGQVLMPGNTLIPVSMRIVQADSRSNGRARVKLEPPEAAQAL